MTDASQDAWDSLAGLLQDFQTALSRSLTATVGSATLREAAKRIVQQYFRVARPYLAELQINAEFLALLDFEVQSLLVLSNKRSRKQSYSQVLRRIRSLLQKIEFEREVRLGQLLLLPVDLPLALTSVEKRIVETLAQLVPSAALSYEQAIRDLDSKERISFRGTANELREALREVLDHLAPDDKVTNAPGFKLESGRTKPTQKQKVKYILKSRGLSRTAINAPQDSVSIIEELTASLARSTYERSSLSTHVTTARQEVEQVKMYIDIVLVELLEIRRV
jgi:Predicted pPIWI-associating nuclease